MYIIPYPWTKEELNKMAYEKEDRFGGILIPFLGGALIGSYFFPRPNYQNQPIAMGPIPQATPNYPYYPVNSTILPK